MSERTFILDFGTRKVTAFSRPDPAQLTTCCGAIKAPWGEAHETLCNDCGVELCSECAAEFDVDGEDYEGSHKQYASAKCAECKEDQ